VKRGNTEDCSLRPAVRNHELAAPGWGTLVALPALVGLLAAFLSQDILGMLSVSGLIAAGALFVWRPGMVAWRVRPSSAVSLALAGLAAFIFGGALGGTILTAALAASVGYARIGPTLRQEDAHLFLIPVLMGAFVAVGVGVLFLVSGTGLRDTIRADIALQIGMSVEAVRTATGMLFGSRSEMGAFATWIAERPGPFLMGSLLATQTIIGYLGLRWVRTRIGWLHPIWGNMLLFRVRVRFAPILIVALLFFVLSPYVAGVDLAAMGAPLVFWFAAGCFLAGVACAVHTVARFRLAQRTTVANVYLAVLAVMLFFAPHAFVIVGLVDIWFDLRRLTPKKGET